MTDLPKELVETVRGTCILAGRMAGCGYPSCACILNPREVLVGWNAALNAMAAWDRVETKTGTLLRRFVRSAAHEASAAKAESMRVQK